MNTPLSLQPSEKTEFLLRSLYDSYGYSNYKMNKFEEYDLYARNKDFLISDGVITFTDTNGKLMALKPDVTLSIVKNTKDEECVLNKLYYNENVYRVSKGTKTFKEIMQVGLECIGDIDDYSVSEVILLAKKSLDVISSDNVLDVSHLGVIDEFMDYCGVPEDMKNEVLSYMGEKNVHELLRALKACGVPDEKTEELKKLVLIHGKANETLPELKKLVEGKINNDTLLQLESVIALFSGEVNIDFSVVDDLHYYNGFVFKGFVEGIPNFVLSGGQYDKLMRKMNRKSGAVGFAVYLDQLEQLSTNKEKYDIDTVLLYDSNASINEIKSARAVLAETGRSVLTAKKKPEGIRCRILAKLENGEVKIIGTNA